MKPQAEQNGAMRDKVARGVAWNMAEKVGSALLQMAVSIIVLRLLMPDDFGVVAILTALTTLAQVAIDSGFSQLLIRKEHPAPGEYRTVFLFNMAVSWLLYGLLTATAPLIARFYQQPVIAAIAPVFYLILPATACGSIQSVRFMRRFRFALLSKVTFFATLLSGLTGVGMAMAGCGVWSLAGQRLSLAVFRSAALWVLSDWRPDAVPRRRDMQTLRSMAPFSVRLMATDFVAALYNKVPQLFIGRLYNADLLGYYDQALKLKDLPVNSAMLSVQNVTFPSLSKIAGDRAKFAESYRQVLSVVTYVMFPIMAGMIGVADEMFSVLLDEKWMPTVPYFKAASLIGLFYPIAVTAYNVLKVHSDGRMLIRTELLKKTIMTLLLAVTIPQSVMAVMWALAAMSAVEAAVNFVATTRFTALTTRQFLRTLAPTAAVTAALYGAVMAVGAFVPAAPAAMLMLKIVTGVTVYAGLSALFRLEAFSTMRRAFLQILRP